MEAERLEFLFGDEADDVAEAFDLDDESDLVEAVERHLPLPGYSPMLGARTAIRAVLVSQILLDEPPEVWQTVQRLRDTGLGRENILRQLSMVVEDQFHSVMESRTPADPEAYGAALAELPLPDAEAIERVLIETARRQPGIGVEDHVDAAVDQLVSGPNQLVEDLVGEALDYLIEGPLHWLPGDLTMYVPGSIDRKAFTHRLSGPEQETGALNVGFDCGAFARIEGVKLPDGTSLEPLMDEREQLVWSGPEGWLAAYPEGALLAITAELTAGNGPVDEPIRATVSIEALESEPRLDEAVVAAVKSAYEDLVAEAGLPVSGEALALWLCFHRPEVVESLQLPLGELCAEAGLERRAGYVAGDDEIWRNDVLRARYVRVLSATRDESSRRVLGTALRVLDDPAASAEEVREALEECAEAEPLGVLADMLIPHAPEPGDADERDGSDARGWLFDFVDRATAVARRPREVASAEFLACVLHERCGAPEEAEIHLARAVASQPMMGLLVERMGWYRFDRGDARGAMKWWSGLAEPHEAAATIKRFVNDPSGSAKPARNAPCWCGSGRKYKKCHLGELDLPPLPDRVGWLARKSSTWLVHAGEDLRDAVIDLAVAYAGGDPVDTLGGDLHDDDFTERVNKAFADPIVMDAALHEGGLFGLFLRERGALLPEDEQLLAAAWQTVDRSVHEVVALDAGAGMTLRDLRTGEELSVRERSLSRQAEVGLLYCARVVPDGESHQIIGGVVPVRAGTEATVLDLCERGDARELCAWAGALAAPPRVVQQPGMIREMFDVDAIEGALDALDEDADESDIMATLGAALSQQARSRWLDENIPALGGLTPREAAADPTRREQLERLLGEIGRGGPPGLDAGSMPEGFVSIDYDVPGLRRELGLD